MNDSCSEQGDYDRTPPVERPPSRRAPGSARPKSWILIISLLIATAFGGVPGWALAYWKQNQDVLHNSAHTLRQGDSIIGLFTPFQYGIADEFMVGLHPVLLLLLTPNLHIRARILPEPVTVTLAASYAQTFIEPQETEVGSAFPGTAEGGALVSFYPSPVVSITPYVGYAVDFATTTSTLESSTIVYGLSTTALDFGTRVKKSRIRTHLLDQGISYGVGLNWLLSSSDMILVQAKTFVSLVSGVHDIPTGLAMWLHSWELVGVGVGAAVGNFVIRTGQKEFVDLPVYPVFDFWVAF